jgi:1-acyl-sn-glycerol-3-phosphate acyltransferase
MPCGLLIFILKMLGFKKASAFITYKIGQGWGNLIIKLSGCRLTVKGRENIPQEGGVCFISNHGSIFDVVLMLAMARRSFGIIAKKELGLVPLLNLWILLIGGFFLDRGHPRKAVKSFNGGIKRIKEGGAMLIFPEGTRSKGRGLLPFHAGSFKLATQSNAVIVPVAIKGSYDVFERDFLVHPAPVSITFAPPLTTADIAPENRRQNLADRVQHIIADILDSMP